MIQFEQTDPESPLVLEKKCDQQYFGDLAVGKKTFDIRLYDFRFWQGRKIRFKEYDRTNKYYTGHYCDCEMIYGVIITIKDANAMYLDHFNQYWSKELIQTYGLIVFGVKVIKVGNVLSVTDEQVDTKTHSQWLPY